MRDDFFHASFIFADMRNIFGGRSGARRFDGQEPRLLRKVSAIINSVRQQLRQHIIFSYQISILQPHNRNIDLYSNHVKNI